MRGDLNPYITPHRNPPNPTNTNQIPLSTPKRAIRDEHSLVKERINSIVNTYSDYAENGALPSSSGNTTRYQLDSLFEDFESMAKGKDETLDMVHENLKRSEAVGTEMLKNVEEEVARSGGGENGATRIAFNTVLTLPIQQRP